jgi:pimeloyl-ACP methyl ester carboxylesterase
MCLCCCPPAISAILCLFIQSGCSKGTVAGALTFFPPEPSLYEFERRDKEGNQLSSEDTEEVKESNAPDTDTHGQTQKKLKSPAQQLTDQAAQRRKRSKERNTRDAEDVKAGVTYKLLLDPRLHVPPHEESAISAVKIPSKRGVYIAAVVYKIPADRQNALTKTMIYSHGNATDVGAMFPIQVVLAHSLDVNVVMYDYSGYGESGGVPDEAATYRDIDAVYDYVFDEVAEGNAANILLYGQSVGSGPCCYLAAKNSDIGGMILHSPFTSGMRVLTPSRALACLDIYPNIDRIKNVKCPVMVIHGRLDQEVEMNHGLELHKAVPQQYQRDPWWVPDRGHNDITDGPGKLAEYIRRIRGFLIGLESPCEL